MEIDKKQIEIIVEKIVQVLAPSKQNTTPMDPVGGKDGVFREMEDAIQAAVVAHQQLVKLPLATREKIVLQGRRPCLEP